MKTYAVTVVLKVEASSKEEAQQQVREVLGCLTYRHYIERVQEWGKPTYSPGGIAYIII